MAEVMGRRGRGLLEPDVDWTRFIPLSVLKSHHARHLRVLAQSSDV